MAGQGERVLCVRREDLFAGGAWHGFTGEGLERVQRLVRERSVFMPLYSFLCVLRSSALAMADLRVLATNRALLRGTTASTA